MSDEVLREYALNNLRATLAGLRAYDRASVAQERTKGIPSNWRTDRLEAAARWATIAEALRPDEIKIVNNVTEVAKSTPALETTVRQLKEMLDRGAIGVRG